MAGGLAKLDLAAFQMAQLTKQVEEVNQIITEDSKMISETISSPITSTASLRETHLMMESLLRPNLISGGNPGRSWRGPREDMSLKTKADEKTYLISLTNKIALKSPTEHDLC